MIEIVLSRRAREDLKAIWRYTNDQWGETQATQYLWQLDLAIKQLRQFPEIGKPHRFNGMDYRVFQTGEHLIFYRLDAESLRIVRVLHKSMDVASRLG